MPGRQWLRTGWVRASGCRLAAVARVSTSRVNSSAPAKGAKLGSCWRHEPVDPDGCRTARPDHPGRMCFTKVTSRDTYDGPALPRPDRIIIQDFAATPAEVPADSALTAEAAAPAAKTAEDIE